MTSPMRSAGIGAVAVLLCLAAAVTAACSSEAERSSNDADQAGQTGPSDPADTDNAPTRAAFGLDVRPSNATCLAPPRPPGAGAVKLERVFANVNVQHVMAMAQPPGDASRWFVANRWGTIWSFPAANPPSQPRLVADLPGVAQKAVATELSGGLLGMAFHPSFATNGRLYVTFTTRSGSSYASEVGYLTSTDGGESFGSYRKVFDFRRPNLEYNGGGIAFGTDGDLYLGFGSAGADAQRTSNYFGTVVRLDVDHPSEGRPYGIPSNNPFKDGGGAPEIFAWGFRNPFRLSVDRETGELWVGDVGHARYEEVDRVAVGKNYGWPCREGAHDRWRSACASGDQLVDPTFEYAHGSGGACVTGGVVYRGAAMPALQGTYVYADFMTLEVSMLTFDPATGAARSVPVEGGPSRGFTHFAEDEDGEIYLSTVSDHEIYKLVPATPSVASELPERLSETGCVDPLDPKRPAPGVIPFDVNAALWSDGAEKERGFAIPDGETISVLADGRLDLPIGSVVMKTFSLESRRVETRFLVRHDDGEWAGYTYEWNDEQTDAALLPSRKAKVLEEQEWTFPSRSDCVRCHGAGGRTLGLELGQLNRDAVYETTSRIANQLRTFEHIGLLSSPLGKPLAEVAAYPAPFGDAPLEARARAYLHANCSMCHRPGGNAGRAQMDFRFGTSLAKTKACNVAPTVDDLDVKGAKILDPGRPATSIVSLRTRTTSAKRMPPLGTSHVDREGVSLLDAWIRALSCP
jgi:uncharacterized repeat protein (TIGR03806 family)